MQRRLRPTPKILTAYFISLQITRFTTCLLRTSATPSGRREDIQLPKAHDHPEELPPGDMGNLDPVGFHRSVGVIETSNSTERDSECPRCFPKSQMMT